MFQEACITNSMQLKCRCYVHYMNNSNTTKYKNRDNYYIL